MLKIEAIREKQRRGEELTPNERRRLNKWWAEQRRNPVTPSASAYRASELGFNFSAPSGLRCFKCGVQLHEVTATFGKLPKFMKVEDFDIPTGQIEEKWFVSQRKVAACAEHALLLKPQRDKNHCLDFRTYD